LYNQYQNKETELGEKHHSAELSLYDAYFGRWHLLDDKIEETKKLLRPEPTPDLPKHCFKVPTPTPIERSDLPQFPQPRDPVKNRADGYIWGQSVRPADEEKEYSWQQEGVEDIDPLELLRRKFEKRYAEMVRKWHDEIRAEAIKLRNLPRKHERQLKSCCALMKEDMEIAKVRSLVHLIELECREIDEIINLRLRIIAVKEMIEELGNSHFRKIKEMRVLHGKEMQSIRDKWLPKIESHSAHLQYLLKYGLQNDPDTKDNSSWTEGNKRFVEGFMFGATVLETITQKYEQKLVDQKKKLDFLLHSTSEAKEFDNEESIRNMRQEYEDKCRVKDREFAEKETSMKSRLNELERKLESTIEKFKKYVTESGESFSGALQDQALRYEVQLADQLKQLNDDDLHEIIHPPRYDSKAAPLTKKKMADQKPVLFHWRFIKWFWYQYKDKINDNSTEWVVKNIIERSVLMEGCRYIELSKIPKEFKLNWDKHARKGSNRWFRSHVWALPFNQLVDSIENDYAEDDGVWVDIFCVNQNPTRLKYDLTRLRSDLRTIGRVTFQVDTEMTIFTRIWCMCEAAEAIRGGAQITLSLIAVDALGDRRRSAKGEKEKDIITHEIKEYLEMMRKKASQIDIKTCNATKPSDKNMILNEISETIGIEETNQILRSEFGATVERAFIQEQAARDSAACINQLVTIAPETKIGVVSVSWHYGFEMWIENKGMSYTKTVLSLVTQLKDALDKFSSERQSKVFQIKTYFKSTVFVTSDFAFVVCKLQDEQVQNWRKFIFDLPRVVIATIDGVDLRPAISHLLHTGPIKPDVMALFPSGCDEPGRAKKYQLENDIFLKC